MSEAEKTPPSGLDFTTFVLSLSTAALQHLGIGLGEDGKGEGKPAPNFVMAQQTIDILALLQTKTKGNLTESEEKLLGNVLYDLRMRYVDAKRS